MRSFVAADIFALKFYFVSFLCILHFFIFSEIKIYTNYYRSQNRRLGVLINKLSSISGFADVVLCLYGGPHFFLKKYCLLPPFPFNRFLVSLLSFCKSHLVFLLFASFLQNFAAICSTDKCKISAKLGMRKFGKKSAKISHRKNQKTSRN